MARADETPKPDKKESANAVLLQTVGSLAATHLYQTYLNIGFIADAKVEGSYEEKQAKELLDGWPKAAGRERQRYPLLATYDHCLKCSHLFNLMDARGVISTTERAALMGRVRTVACRTATAYLEQLTPGTPKAEVRL